jgi:hypothetical protein
MYTMIVNMTLDPNRADDVAGHFRRDVAPWATRQPGFVSGQWLRGADGRSGLGVVVFDTETSANAAAQGPRGYTHDEARAWNVDGVDVFEQVEHA